MKLLRSALVVAAAAVVLVPSAAHADANGHRDSVGDVRSVAADPATGQVTTSPSTAEPTASLGDIKKVRAVHGSGTITITMRFRDLAKAGFGHVHEIAIASPERSRIVVVRAYRGHWNGKVEVRTPQGKKARCSVQHRISYARDKVTVRVPRSCVGNPKVVKVGAFTSVGYGSKVYYDDAYRMGGEYTDPFGLSPRIRR